MTRIALVDDDKNIVTSLSLALKGEGFVVEAFEDGAAALEALTSQPSDSFDIGIFDIKMPKMDGMEVLDKAMEIAPDVPVIMISAHGTIETAVEATKKGARGGSPASRPFRPRGKKSAVGDTHRDLRP